MLSILLSTNNDLKRWYLERILERLRSENAQIEIIAGDNMSSDGTREILMKYAVKIIDCPESNRAQRFNAALREATGEVVLFHHSASLLPAGFSWHIFTKKWGCFRHSFDVSHPLLRFTSWYSNEIRARRKWIVYFDHCPFMTRELAVSVDGVPEMDIFEDTVFSQGIREKIGLPILLKETLITSASRFTSRGIWRQAILNQWLKLRFLLGGNHTEMNRVYEREYGYNRKY